MVLPPAAYGVTWWNSRKPRSSQRPLLPTNAQRRPSRSQTSRLTRAGTWRVGAVDRTGARALRSGQLLLHDVRQQQRQRSIEDRGDVAVRDAVTQQVLDTAKPVVRLTGNRELDLVALRWIVNAACGASLRLLGTIVVLSRIFGEAVPKSCQVFSSPCEKKLRESREGALDAAQARARTSTSSRSKVRSSPARG